VTGLLFIYYENLKQPVCLMQRHHSGNPKLLPHAVVTEA